MGNILQVSDLNKAYKTFKVSNVSFSVPQNSITGLIGVNGAGKTTTIKMLLKLVNADFGSVKIANYDMFRQETLAKEHLGVVLDDGGLYENLTTYQMKQVISHCYKSWDNDIYKDLVSKFKLPIKQKICTLSKGMHIKTALVLAMSHHAKLLIMDEPTSGLDPLIRTQLLSMLKEYVKKENASVLFSTHITTDLDKIADRIIMMDNGQVLWEEKKEDLIKKYAVISGPNSLISRYNQAQFIRVNKTDNHWRALVLHEQFHDNIIPPCRIEEPSIEDVMFGFIEGDYND